MLKLLELNELAIKSTSRPYSYFIWPVLMTESVFLINQIPTTTFV